MLSGIADFDRATDYLSEHGSLPEGCDCYHWANKRGWTVAHMAAELGHLPAWFKDYHLKDDRGVTVAHIASAEGNLPEWFKDYLLADESGWTVAHVAAICGNLPEWFDDWYLKTTEGETVIQVWLNAGMRGAISHEKYFLLKLSPGYENAEEETVAEYILKNSDKIHFSAREKLYHKVVAWMVSRISNDIEVNLENKLKNKPRASFKK